MPAVAGRVVTGRLALTAERDSVRFGATTIEYEVRRSPRRHKTVQITVDGGGVEVIAPSATPGPEVRAIVAKRAAWILARLAEAGGAAGSAGTVSSPVPTPRRFVSGETLPYLGRNVRLIVEPAAAGTRLPEVRFDHWRFRIAVPPGLDDFNAGAASRVSSGVGVGGVAGDVGGAGDGGERRERIKRAVVKWYRARAGERVPACVARWHPRLGRGPAPRVLIRDQRQRWGSCAPDGTLRFNWRAVMLEPALIDYIVVHELAHLTVRSHSPEFWRIVTAAMPDAQHRRRRLREAGRSLPL